MQTNEILSSSDEPLATSTLKENAQVSFVYITLYNPINPFRYTEKKHLTQVTRKYISSYIFSIGLFSGLYHTNEYLHAYLYNINRKVNAVSSDGIPLKFAYCLTTAKSSLLSPRGEY